ncbi:hypothetical protein EV421DRAFT_1896421 [Armillaria borealis]|uniref:Uncharacterized protein n=1 Tax=Armillaria borealis TaxID=47425 RepID=A0AA39N1I4_9AGAR|nr:hypothetical protein EV421DRAFT_1896421 [Armillaria borealis]
MPALDLKLLHWHMEESASSEVFLPTLKLLMLTFAYGQGWPAPRFFDPRHTKTRHGYLESTTLCLCLTPLNLSWLIK